VRTRTDTDNVEDVDNDEPLTSARVEIEETRLDSMIHWHCGNVGLINPPPESGSGVRCEDVDVSESFGVACWRSSPSSAHEYRGTGRISGLRVRINGHDAVIGPFSV
jgi:hypothetical protein